MSDFKVIGLMSGTSLDGLDICYAHFKKTTGKWRGEILRTTSVDYSVVWRNKLANAICLSEGELKRLDIAFGKLIAEEVNTFISAHALGGKVDFISSHGHTVFHQPEKKITVQIGNGQIIANETVLKVICDFRSLDVSLGGQGAPLVPIGDELLFGEFDACLNLGGISNISFRDKGDRIAFDIAPCNLPLNKIMRNTFQMEFDRNGEYASKGKGIPQLKDELDKLGYYEKSPPKSLGLEWLNAFFYPIIERYEKQANEDILHTIVLHEVAQISNVLKANAIKSVLVTGGGAFNSFFIEKLKEETNASIIIPTAQIIAFKEAYVFALLGVLHFVGENNALKSVTGASRDSSGGSVYDPHIKV